MIALDGEREIRANPGDRVSFTLSRLGPRRILPREILREAARLGIYKNQMNKE